MPGRSLRVLGATLLEMGTPSTFKFTKVEPTVEVEPCPALNVLLVTAVILSAVTRPFRRLSCFTLAVVLDTNPAVDWLVMPVVVPLPDAMTFGTLRLTMLLVNVCPPVPSQPIYTGAIRPTAALIAGLLNAALAT